MASQLTLQARTPIESNAAAGMNEVSPDTLIDNTRQKTGPKKGTKRELAALRAGGVGGLARGNKDAEEWKLDNTLHPKRRDHLVDLDADDSSYSSESSASSVYSEENFGIVEEEDETCLTDMVGNRILPVGKVAKVLRKDTCCRRCAVRNHKTYITKFLKFCKEEEEKVALEESRQLFLSRTQRLEWRVAHTKTTGELYQIFCGKENMMDAEARICCDFHVSEETWGIATSLYGQCRRSRKPHSFSIEASELSSGPVKKSLHGNSRTARYSVNYQLCAAIQQMGCGRTDAKTLLGFLDLPSSAKIDAHLAVVEKTLGRIEITVKDAAQAEALQKEIEEMKRRGLLKEYTGKEPGHEYGPYPLIRITYGK